MTAAATNLVGDEGAVGILNDGGQSAVVVQEHYNLLPFRAAHYLLEHAEGRGVLKLHDHVLDTCIIYCPRRKKKWNLQSKSRGLRRRRVFAWAKTPALSRARH